MSLASKISSPICIIWLGLCLFYLAIIHLTCFDIENKDIKSLRPYDGTIKVIGGYGKSTFEYVALENRSPRYPKRSEVDAVWLDLEDAPTIAAFPSQREIDMGYCVIVGPCVSPMIVNSVIWERIVLLCTTLKYYGDRFRDVPGSLMYRVAYSCYLPCDGGLAASP